jgi:hypothetical protein
VESGTWYNNYHTDLQLAAEALQVQRQALMAILRPYMSRPDEINYPTDDSSDEYGQHQHQLLHHQTVSTRKEDVDIDQDQSTAIHLRVLRSTAPAARPHYYSVDHLSTPAVVEQQRRRQPNWTMTAELVDESDGQPSVVVMESRSSLMMNTSDGHDTTINHIPMVCTVHLLILFNEYFLRNLNKLPRHYKA